MKTNRDCSCESEGNRKKKKRIIIFVVIIVLALLILGGTYVWLKMYMLPMLIEKVSPAFPPSAY